MELTHFSVNYCPLDPLSALSPLAVFVSLFHYTVKSWWQGPSSIVFFMLHTLP